MKGFKLKPFKKSKRKLKKLFLFHSLWSKKQIDKWWKERKNHKAPRFSKIATNSNELM